MAERVLANTVEEMLENSRKFGQNIWSIAVIGPVTLSPVAEHMISTDFAVVEAIARAYFGRTGYLVSLAASVATPAIPIPA